jgi:type IV pilus assembly protein PilE
MKFQKGFTLIELMIVVAIIAILAAVAIPNYSTYVTRGKLAEAATALSSLRVGFEQYYQDNRTYVNAANPGGCAVDVTLSNTKNFTFSCSGISPTTFLITATGIAGAGGFIFDVNQSNFKTTPAVPAHWALPTPNNCWVTKPGGVC